MSVLLEESRLEPLAPAGESIRCLPNFIYAGAPKAGSSSLYHYIKQHPEIFMSEVKEPFFFDFNYDRGLDWYEKHFQAGRDYKVRGEATVWYMRWPDAAERIASHVPNAKLLFVLRNPIERAWSNYWHDFASGHYSPLTPFGRVIREEGTSIKNRMIVRAGMYYEHLTRFERYFPREQMMIILYEELKEDSLAVARRVFEFLNVDGNFEPRVDEKLMVTSGVRLYPFLDAVFQLDKKFRLDAMPRLWDKRHVRQLMHSQRKSKPKMRMEDRKWLREKYQKPNEQLAEYLGIDLPTWD